VKISTKKKKRKEKTLKTI